MWEGRDYTGDLIRFHTYDGFKDRGGRGSARFHSRHRGRRSADGTPDDGQDAFSAGAQRLPAHRPRQVDLPQFRRRAGVRRILQPPDGRHEPGQGRRRVRGLDSGRRALARFRVAGTDTVRVGLLRAALSLGRRADSSWQRVRGRPQRRSDSRLSRYADRARTRESVPRSPGRGEPRSLPPDARGRVSRRISRAARADRHGIAESQPSRSRALSHPARDPSPDRRCVVHLPDVRLRAPAVGSGRAHHAFALYARVRGSSASVRLGARVARLRSTPAADRIRPAEPHLHDDEQAAPAAAGAGRHRTRLGRSAHADASLAFAGAATRRKPFAISAIGLASRRKRTPSTSRCWSTACARISTGGLRAPWPS